MIGLYALTSDITSAALLYDAGTEVDQYAGAGKDQPVRQDAANTGDAENSNVIAEINVVNHVPSLENMVRITISSN